MRQKIFIKTETAIPECARHCIVNPPMLLLVYYESNKDSFTINKPPFHSMAPAPYCDENNLAFN
jgi:hypothetical protein